ncbi:MAG: hypothetical protein QW076_02935 [Candidatus Anstonellales archaeon]
MHGLHYAVIFGIIIIVIVIILIIIFAVNPSILFGKITQTQLSFRDCCVFWSLNNYKDTGTIIYRDKSCDMNQLCQNALGIIGMSASDWEKCRNLCRGIV